MISQNVDSAAKAWATERLAELEAHFDADVITTIGPILPGWENLIRPVLESLPDKRKTLVVVLDTSGGVAEVVERIARIFRHLYSEVRFLVPDRAMSAGTILAMSGDAIYMDYHSCLGPIDPQVEREGKLVPALSYLVQYADLIEKSNAGQLSTAELVLLQKLDLAELHQFELARDLSITLLKQWLTKYKFKDWKETETSKTKVTMKMKVDRAAEIAEALNDHTRWHTHGRGLDMETLRGELNLKIDDYSDDERLESLVADYFWFLRDYMNRQNFANFIHTREFM